MSRFNPNNLYIHYNRTGPEASAAPRRYTLAHYCKPNAMILAVGPEYDLNSTDPWGDDSLTRQLIFAEWREEAGTPALFLYQGQCLTEAFKDCSSKEPLAHFLRAIRYGDRHLFSAFPRFDEAAIFLMTPNPENGEATRRYLGKPANYQYDQSNSETPSLPLDPVNWLRFE